MSGKIKKSNWSKQYKAIIDRSGHSHDQPMHVGSSDKMHHAHRQLQKRTTPIRIRRVGYLERRSNTTIEEGIDKILQKESCKKVHQPYHDCYERQS